MDSNAPNQAHPSQPTDSQRGIPVDAWNLCSRIFVEGRRMRAMVGDLRTMDGGDLTPAARHAIEQYAIGLASTAALGDVAAESVVSPRSDDALA